MTSPRVSIDRALILIRHADPQCLESMAYSRELLSHSIFELIQKHRVTQYFTSPHTRALATAEKILRPGCAPLIDARIRGRKTGALEDTLESFSTIDERVAGFLADLNCNDGDLHSSVLAITHESVMWSVRRVLGCESAIEFTMALLNPAQQIPYLGIWIVRNINGIFRIDLG